MLTSLRTYVVFVSSPIYIFILEDKIIIMFTGRIRWEITIKTVHSCHGEPFLKWYECALAQVTYAQPHTKDLYVLCRNKLNLTNTIRVMTKLNNSGFLYLYSSYLSNYNYEWLNKLYLSISGKRWQAKKNWIFIPIFTISNSSEKNCPPLTRNEALGK